MGKRHIFGCSYVITNGANNTHEYQNIGKDAKLSEESLANLLKKMSEVELSESLKDSINSGYDKLELTSKFNLSTDEDIFINLDKNNKDSEKLRVVYCSFSDISCCDGHMSFHKL